MSKISEVKKELRHKEWSEEIRACQSSGMKVKDWCYMKGIKPDTVRAQLFCHPKVSAFCQGKTLYFVKIFGRQ